MLEKSLGPNFFVTPLTPIDSGLTFLPFGLEDNNSFKSLKHLVCEKPSLEIKTERTVASQKEITPIFFL